jgi:hypothetical protein
MTRQWIVTGVSMVVEADSEEEAIERAEQSSGWHWEAEEQFSNDDLVFLQDTSNNNDWWVYSPRTGFWSCFDADEADSFDWAIEFITSGHSAPAFQGLDTGAQAIAENCGIRS